MHALSYFKLALSVGHARTSYNAFGKGSFAIVSDNKQIIKNLSFFRLVLVKNRKLYILVLQRIYKISCAVSYILKHTLIVTEGVGKSFQGEHYALR